MRNKRMTKQSTLSTLHFCFSGDVLRSSFQPLVHYFSQSGKDADQEFLMSRSLRNLLLLVCAMLLCITAFAQKTTGDIKGVVTDPQGAVVQGAKVTAHNVAT